MTIPVIMLDELHGILNTRAVGLTALWARDSRLITGLGFRLFRVTEWGITVLFEGEGDAE